MYTKYLEQPADKQSNLPPQNTATAATLSPGGSGAEASSPASGFYSSVVSKKSNKDASKMLLPLVMDDESFGGSGSRHEGLGRFSKQLLFADDEEHYISEGSDYHQDFPLGSYRAQPRPLATKGGGGGPTSPGSYSQAVASHPTTTTTTTATTAAAAEAEAATNGSSKSNSSSHPYNNNNNNIVVAEEDDSPRGLLHHRHRHHQEDPLGGWGVTPPNYSKAAKWWSPGIEDAGRLATEANFAMSSPATTAHMLGYDEDVFPLRPTEDFVHQSQVENDPFQPYASPAKSPILLHNSSFSSEGISKSSKEIGLEERDWREEDDVDIEEGGGGGGVGVALSPPATSARVTRSSRLGVMSLFRDRNASNKDGLAPGSGSGGGVVVVGGSGGTGGGSSNSNKKMSRSSGSGGSKAPGTSVLASSDSNSVGGGGGGVRHPNSIVSGQSNIAAPLDDSAIAGATNGGSGLWDSTSWGGYPSHSFMVTSAFAPRPGETFATSTPHLEPMRQEDLLPSLQLPPPPKPIEDQKTGLSSIFGSSSPTITRGGGRSGIVEGEFFCLLCYCGFKTAEDLFSHCSSDPSHQERTMLDVGAEKIWQCPPPPPHRPTSSSLHLCSR